jgi:DNA-binding transcriptional ArsR family regulator
MAADQLSLILTALRDPTRRAILAQLISGERDVTTLAEPFEMTMPAVTKHLVVLENAGLIEQGRDGQMRPCQLQAVPLEKMSTWVEQYRQSWEESLESLESLDSYLKESRSKEKGNAITRNRKRSK